MVQVICRNCAHYTPRGECKMFRYVDLVTGVQRYHSAHKARYSDNMCTKEGHKYVPKKEAITTHTIVCSPEGCGVVITNVTSIETKQDLLSYDGIVYNSCDDDRVNDVY